MKQYAQSASVPCLSPTEEGSSLDREIRKQTAPKQVTHPSPLRFVPRTTGGDPLTTASLPANYRLEPGPSEAEASIRSMEPFASIEVVWAVDFEETETMWIIGSKSSALLVGHLRVAGRQVHFRPEDVFRPHTTPPPFFLISTIMRHLADPVITLDPRFPVLDNRDLNQLRQALPFVVGIRIFQYGEVEVLCNENPEEVLPKDEWPLTIGGLPYFVTQTSPSRTVSSSSSHLIPYGAKVLSGAHNSGACLGVKIIGPDGESAITAVTHAFVSNPSIQQHSLPQKILDAFLVVPWLLRQSLSFLLPRSFSATSTTPHPQSIDLPITSTSPWADKLEVPLLGVEVFNQCIDGCARERADIGIVSDVFDFPSASKPYPAGYVHDLYLIRGPNLPEIVSIPGLPRLTSFIPYRQAFEMRDRALFTITYPYTGNEKSEVRGLLLTGRTMDITTRECLLSGAQIMLGSESNHVQNISHSILWRSKARYIIRRPPNSAQETVTISKPTTSDGDYLSAAGYSGSVLCVGSDAASSTTPIPATAEVLAIQNFETALPSAYGIPDSSFSTSLLTYKGGFRLPDYIYASKIVMPGGVASSTSAKEELVLRQHLTRRRSHSV
ncbi:hypothetical protein DFH09DRAFT_1177157 [Mycena vulgaris]|nr:hypothetical protein DFH09DRAFT_1177157 [Mycena vulgaris]